MKKIGCLVLMIAMIIFLVNPLSSNARGGHSGSGYWRGGYGRGGYWVNDYWDWWAPWAVIGGAAVLAPYYYSPYYAPPPVVIQEQPPVDGQPVPSSTERIFIYPRKGQSEELQAKDRYDCHRWGVNQTGYDPTQPTSGITSSVEPNACRL